MWPLKGIFSCIYIKPIYGLIKIRLRFRSRTGKNEESVRIRLTVMKRQLYSLLIIYRSPLSPFETDTVLLQTWLKTLLYMSHVITISLILNAFSNSEHYKNNAKNEIISLNKMATPHSSRGMSISTKHGGAK